MHTDSRKQRWLLSALFSIASRSSMLAVVARRHRGAMCVIPANVADASVAWSW